MITTYLEMNSPSEFIEKPDSKELTIVEVEIKDFRFNRYLYGLVGELWYWTDKLALSDAEWEEYAESDNLRTWVAYYRGSIVGYFELNSDSEFNVEIAYFGLAPKFIGKGYGGYLLSRAIKSAWQDCGAKRVWVHTCTLDHPNALRNYQACGLKVYLVE
ncbi:GNAT family N-acetyltransferase [Nitrincola tibetensis]|nr:GNAT family N-acetyltransferase [Nitrincola tibetensis]